jgi:hypothetical protein
MEARGTPTVEEQTPPSALDEVLQDLMNFGQDEPQPPMARGESEDAFQRRVRGGMERREAPRLSADEQQRVQEILDDPQYRDELNRLQLTSPTRADAALQILRRGR